MVGALLKLSAVLPLSCCPALQFLTQDTLYRFPYFTTFSLDYSAEAVKMLSQMNTAVLLQHDVERHVHDLVQIASGAHAAAA